MGDPDFFCEIFMQIWLGLKDFAVEFVFSWGMGVIEGMLDPTRERIVFFEDSRVDDVLSVFWGFLKSCIVRMVVYYKILLKALLSSCFRIDQSKEKI